jgi:hypothetical protein
MYPSPQTSNAASKSTLYNGRNVGTSTSPTEHIADNSLLEAVARFCKFLRIEPYRDGNAASTVIVYFAGVLGIVRDGSTFERPSNYTPKLSALIHSARLCLLEATLPRFAYPRLGWNARPSLGQDEVLNKMREAYLCQGSAAPIGEPLSLRAYGRTVSRTDGPAFRVEWSEQDATVKWDEGKMNMEQSRALGHRSVDLVLRAGAGRLSTKTRLPSSTSHGTVVNPRTNR